MFAELSQWWSTLPELAKLWVVAVSISCMVR